MRVDEPEATRYARRNVTTPISDPVGPKRSMGPSDRGRHLWAKSPRGGMSHSLLGHLLDVGVAASVLLEDRRADVDVVADGLGLEFEEARRWMVVLAALHDLGKATPTFQAKWPDGAPPEALGRAWIDLPHGRATWVLLHATLRDLGWSGRVARAAAHAVGVHHGVLDDASQIRPGAYDPTALGEDRMPWDGWRRALVDDVRAAFGATAVPGATRSPILRTWARLAGLTSVADWIGSSLEPLPPVVDVDQYVRDRFDAVRARLKAIGWPSSGPWWQAPPGEGFASWFGTPDKSFVPFPMQEAVAAAFADPDGPPGLLVIEAPMGEGKTEAAFYALVQDGGARGAYIALPTQATSDALFGRLRTFVDRHAGRGVPLTLAHAAARIAASAPVEGASGDGQAAASGAAWFSTGRRELLAELGVGTVDQALLGVMPSRHHFVRLWALADKTVVIDEVHAFDAYTGGLIASLVEWLAASGARTVLMSATLPRATTAALTAAYARGIGVPAQDVPHEPYPRLTLVDRDGRLRSTSFPARRSATIALRSAPFAIDALADAVAGAAATGAAVGVVVNRVDRAQLLALALRDRVPDLALLHARWPLAERVRREQAVVAHFGPKGTVAERRGVVVGTQVIEQSLDLDFDVLFSDLAPVDLLLQRSGRLHRHVGRERPDPYGAPVLHIAGFGTADAPEEPAVDTVYAAYLMWRTWAALVAKGASVTFPRDLDELVQTVYGDDTLAALEPYGDRLRALEQEHAQATNVAATAAEYHLLGPPSQVASEAWGNPHGDEHTRRPWVQLTPTRLGKRSVTVVPVVVDGPTWRVAGTEGAVDVRARTLSERWVGVALSHQVRIGRDALVRRLASIEPPPSWLATGPLRYVAPLTLDAAARWTEDPSVRLDPSLGLVYEPLTERRNA